MLVIENQPIVFVAAAVGISVVIVFVLFRYYRRNQHQRQINKVIKDLSRQQLKDILIPDSVNGEIWIDCVLLTDGGVIVFDIRDYVGRMFGGDKINEWTQMIGVKSHKFPNPLIELPARIHAVQEIVGGIPVIGHVIFTCRGTFPKGKPDDVYMVDEVYEKLSSFLRPALPTENLEKAWQKLLAVQKPG